MWRTGPGGGRGWYLGPRFLGSRCRRWSGTRGPFYSSGTAGIFSSPPPPLPSLLWGSRIDPPPTKRPAPQREGQGGMKTPLSPTYWVDGDKGQEGGPCKGIQVSGLRLKKKKKGKNPEIGWPKASFQKPRDIFGLFRTFLSCPVRRWVPWMPCHRDEVAVLGGYKRAAWRCAS